MAPREGYCATEDLQLGSVPLPTNGDDLKYIGLAADEIDSVIGMRYKTPVVVDASSPIQRPVGLLLKKINAWLASGRLVMAADASGADDQIQQYGKYLVEEALIPLRQIADGTIVLPGIELSDPEANKDTGPVAAFADEASLVEAHSATFGNPAQQVLNRQNLLPYQNYPYLPYIY